ncbi:MULTISPECIES: acyl-CoA dehydratase activase [Syntrophotalea]|jgi:predicted CoA-substrate-specific enzyme activase|uniref:Benzoyl-CoA reductase n=1 Tax=Syntrophotalea acetylenica TaxID=29542 RepID=A0A1L3GF84_SYNAC|nr:acyl-CoA dehydratase activase [Syntrophotalea acetylenica]APG24560.1 benzoyl-CoA reductase [Syntrophotalea acetylenica]APG45144.1 benzoyl-CoA reductase [Syntrophotalea acetylenica]MDY0262787.1 acyl-CoA dehydratase activase [Syntrophotalea acetylenica]
MSLFAGIDAGSTYLKVALVDAGGNLCGTKTAPTGIDARETARQVLQESCREKDCAVEAVTGIFATGYSRRQIDIAHDHVTEIRAHAAGARWAAPAGVDIRTVIDVGGQDSKVIVLEEDGGIKNFVMNDKCAAGTGRFLEALARVLDLPVRDIGPMALRSRLPCQINSMCVVFAESEVISLLARRQDPVDIVAGIHVAMAKRIAVMARKAGLYGEVLLTGGGGLNPGLVAAFEDELQRDVHTAAHPQLNGAIGAALIAGDLA